MGEYELLNPYFGLIGIAGLLFWLIDYLKLFKTAQLELPSQFFTKSSLKISSIVIFIAGIVSWLLISFSLMGPRKPMGRADSQKELNDIYIVVDCSRSMLAGDFAPNRLEAAKERITQFVKLAPVDRIGIVLFADKVFTLIPATIDLELVAQSVSQINIGPLGNGTNIGDALGLAVARSVTSMANNKSIILMTDGASNVGLLSPIQAAQKAKDSGVKIYTIGIGGDENAKLPLGRDAFGQQRYQNIPGGSMDFKTLDEIANITGGKSFIASSNGALENVLSEINKLERKKIDVSGRVIYKELYLNFLLIGALILLLTELVRFSIRREAY